MITFPAAVATAIRSVQCALLADNEYIVGSVGRFAGPTRDRALEGINATKALLGCDPTPTPLPGPPFTGGQCPGIQYTVQASYVDANDQANSAQNQFVLGPVGGLSFDPPNPSGGVSVFLINGPGGSGRTFFLSTTETNVGTIAITNVFPTFGEPDNCGDPPPQFGPPTNYNTDVDVTYNIDNGDEVTISIPLVYAPIQVDFNGNFRVPVTFDFGGNEFSASFPLNPSLPVTINFPGLNPGDDQGTDDLPPDAPGESVDPTPPDQKIVGVVVTATSIDERSVSSYALPQLTTIYVPRLGSVKFVYNLGGATFFSSDIDVKDRRTFIECPFPGGADAVIASPQVGVNFQFLPIRGFPVATTGDLRAPS